MGALGARGRAHAGTQRTRHADCLLMVFTWSSQRSRSSTSAPDMPCGAAAAAAPRRVCVACGCAAALGAPRSPPPTCRAPRSSAGSRCLRESRRWEPMPAYGQQSADPAQSQPQRCCRWRRWAACGSPAAPGPAAGARACMSVCAWVQHPPALHSPAPLRSNSSPTCWHFVRLELRVSIFGPTGCDHSFHSSAWRSGTRGVCAKEKRSELFTYSPTASWQYSFSSDVTPALLSLAAPQRRGHEARERASERCCTHAGPQDGRAAVSHPPRAPRCSASPRGRCNRRGGGGGGLCGWRCARHQPACRAGATACGPPLST